jgi:hypothetical protein
MYVMSRFSQFSLAILICILAASCENYSNYPIDERPGILIDRGMLGIWRNVEEKQQYNFFLIQDYKDVFNPTGANILGDESSGEGQYKDYKKFNYYITEADNSAAQTKYMQWTGFVSKVNGATFMNLSESYIQNNEGLDLESGTNQDKYYFLRILSINEGRNIIKAVAVQDSTLKYMKNTTQVRNYIARNLNNPTFYGDTVHFYKISNYHLSLKQANRVANPKMTTR